MRKLTLLTSVLLASSFQTGNVSAQCMNTINCQTLGYTKTSCTKGGVKCPTGNYWYCPKDTTTPQCSSSYKYTCTGAYQSPSGTACNGKYQKCNCSNNYVWNSSQGKCLAGSGSGSGSGSSSGSDTCTDRIPYPPFTYQYTSETGCGGSYYSERFSICGETIYVCSNGRSVGYDYNVRCEYDDRETLRGYYITDDHKYNMCQNSSGQLKESGYMCEYGRSYGNTRYATLEECERVAATYDDPHVTFTYACGPCVY